MVDFSPSISIRMKKGLQHSNYVVHIKTLYQMHLFFPVVYLNHHTILLQKNIINIFCCNWPSHHFSMSYVLDKQHLIKLNSYSRVSKIILKQFRIFIHTCTNLYININCLNPCHMGRACVCCFSLTGCKHSNKRFI